MEKGKEICRTLKELRKRIAEANDIPYDIEECSYEGDCPGTCPKCEQEVDCLATSIEKREQEGKQVVLEGLMSENDLNKAFSRKLTDEDMICDITAGVIPEPLNETPDPYEFSDHLVGDIEVFDSFDYWCHDGNCRFASIIMQKLLASTNENVLFSPVGLCQILTMLHEGMSNRCEVEENMMQLLLGCNYYINAIERKDFCLEHAASLWYNIGLGEIKRRYVSRMKKNLGAEIHDVDFAVSGKAKAAINKWAAANTHDMIKSVEANISKDTLMVALDAIYMKGKWMTPFDPGLTEKETFHNLDGTSAVVDMMYQEFDGCKYEDTGECQVLCLPYKDSDCCMYIILPHKHTDINTVMAEAEWANFELSECSGDLLLPKFKFDITQSFKKVLSEVGLADMFEKNNSFPKITNAPAYISDIKQQCVIEVEEEGTEAAAVTFIACPAGGPPPSDDAPYFSMYVNRPFGFVIKNEGGQVLFMGVVKNMTDSTEKF